MTVRSISAKFLIPTEDLLALGVDLHSIEKVEFDIDTMVVHVRSTRRLVASQLAVIGFPKGKKILSYGKQGGGLEIEVEMS